MFELCLKLKKAGFPQLERVPRRKVYVACDDTLFKEYTSNFCYVPTEIELITVLEDKSFTLKQNQTEWLAATENERGTGSTPLEALMNLYLATKK